jgi:hypothetical protein
MDDEQAPSRQVRESDKVPVADGILCERHSISITDAAILLAAMTTARGSTAIELAAQIIDANVDPCSHPTPYGTSFVDASPRVRRTDARAEPVACRAERQQRMPPGVPSLVPVDMASTGRCLHDRARQRV